MKTKKILYYCQSLVGVGHLSASLRIIEALQRDGMAVDLIYGGLDAAMPPPQPGLRTLRLPTLLHDEDSGEFFSPDGGSDSAHIDAVWSERARAIAGFLQMPYDAIVVEFYPFGRRRFKGEIGSLFNAVREASGPVPIFTSVREVLVPRAIDNERRMVAAVNKHIHTVFVRGDPQLIAFGETFSLAPQIADKLCHTGYIAPPPPADRPARRPQVLVSQGGGNVGRELIEAAIGAAAFMPQLHFLMACGSRTSAQEIDALRGSAQSSNVEIVPFLTNIMQHLMASAVSINMGGDNTLLDVVRARTPSLAYPYQDNPEQGIRIRKFARAGLVHELTREDLAPERLRALIERALHTPYPQREIAMDGARVTSQRIRAVLDA